jgi:hypothetical protein
VNRLGQIVIVAALLGISSGVLAQGPPNAPFAAQAKMTCAQALKQAPKDDPDLTPLAKSFDADAAKLKKSPKDAKAKKAYVEAGAKYEQRIVRGVSKLNPTVKYRAGLAICRMVLAVDPKNPECKKDESEILDIYKSMGRPVPK